MTAARENFMPALWTENAFTLMRRFSEEMDHVFGDVFADFRIGRPGLASRLGRGLIPQQTQWVPSVDVIERDSQLVVRADLPGLSKDDVNVEVTDDMLTITGERREEYEETREGYRHSERRYGRFSRSLQLPEGVNAEQVRATFENGVLEITMPAPQRKQHGKRIEIEAGHNGGTQKPVEKSGEQPAKGA